MSIGTAPAVIRPYVPADQRSVQQLLAELPALYPGADVWLAGRLAECARGQALCWVAEREAQLVGVIIFTPKSDRLKLANVYVAPDYRRQGIAARLLDESAVLWAAPAWSSVYVTVAVENLDALRGLLGPCGFSLATVVADRYGPGRDEAVLVRSFA